MIHIDDFQIRAVTILPHGQQFSGWLPAGAYIHEGEETLAVASLGTTERHRVARLVRTDARQAETWYVGPAVAVELARTAGNPCDK